MSDKLLKGIVVTYFCILVLFFAFSAKADSSSLTLKVTFPARQDTFDVDKLRIAGGTTPGAKIYINDQPVRVYRHGAFVARIDLTEGLNRIVIRATKQEQTMEDTLMIFRKPILKPLPAVPTAIDSSFFEPNQETWVLPGEVLHVGFKASPGGMARFRFDDEADWLPMVEDNHAAVAGIYRGSVRIPYHFPERWSTICFQICGRDSQLVEINAPFRVRFLPYKVPIVGMTHDETQIWTASRGGTVIGVLPDSIRLLIIGKENRRYRVAFSNSQVFYVNENDLSLLPLGEPLLPSAVNSPTITITDEWLRLAMIVDRPIPFLIEQSVEPAILDLTLYNAYQAHPWITFPETIIKNIAWSQPSEGQVRLRIFLRQRQQWGYRVEYKRNTLYLLIRRTPRFSRDHHFPLQGLNIVINAGHGGREPGAISPTGIAEKDVNLIISKELSKWLRNAGANVQMTRTSDTTLTLRERVQFARKHQAHIFLWIHNNSVGATSDAAAVSGTSTYFTMPQNQKLAWTVYPHLRALGLQPFGRIYSSYYVTRTTDMLVLLVEGAFMSNPLDEQKLAEEIFLRRVSKAIYDGLVEFVGKQKTNFSE